MSKGLSKPKMMFLPGWCCYPSDFSAQIEHFQRSFDLILVDYTEIFSNLKEGDSPLEVLLDGVTNIVKKTCIGDEKLALVGHSMGGALALILASKLPQKIKSCVFIDTSLPRNESVISRFSVLVKQFSSKEGKDDVADFFDEHMTGKYDNIELRERKRKELVAEWSKNPKLYSQLLDEFVHSTASECIASCPCPLLHVAGTPPSANLEAIKKLNPKIKIVSIQSSHFVMLHAPLELNQAVEEFIKTTSID